MTLTCPRCETVNPEAAKYCRRCGLPLKPGPDGILGAGRVGHPEPLAAPEGFGRFQDTPDLFFQWEAAWGGVMLAGTESVAINVFNAGYGLINVKVRIRGEGPTGTPAFVIDREFAEWRRGETIRLEIASWELTAPAAKLVLSMISAAFAPEDT